ncbi:MAG: hypothetical protein ACOCQF_04740 [Halanaerobiaceae bacterium]
MRNGLTQFMMIEDRHYKKAKMKKFDGKVKLNAVNSFEDIDGI